MGGQGPSLRTTVLGSITSESPCWQPGTFHLSGPKSTKPTFSLGIPVSICMKKDTGAFHALNWPHWWKDVGGKGESSWNHKVWVSVTPSHGLWSNDLFMTGVVGRFSGGFLNGEREIWDEERDCSLVKQTCRKSHVPGFSNVAVLFRQFYLINIYFSLLYTVISVQLLEPSCWC